METSWERECIPNYYDDNEEREDIPDIILASISGCLFYKNAINLKKK